MPTYDVAILVGSFRAGSLNQRVARALAGLAPDTLRFSWPRSDDLPFYSGDLEPARTPEVNRFTDAMKAADAALIVTPEYNRSIPAVLKNAIDWGSKPPAENVWRDLPVAMCGTSPGAIGTAVAQQHLRQILAVIGAHVLPGEAYVSFQPPTLIDEAGAVSVDATRDFLAALMTRFATFTGKLRG